MSKPIDQMEEEELCVEIAKKLGIKFRVSDGNMDWIVGERMHRDYADAGDIIGIYYYDDGTPYEDIILDWTTDISAAWQLLADFTDYYIEKSGNNYCVNLMDATNTVADSLPLAICRAWLKWKEMEEG